MKFGYFTLIRRRQPYEAEYNPRLSVRTGAGFPDDMIEEIISRLHPKELCTFKVVSKGFNNLISGRTFSLHNLYKMETLNRAVYIFQAKSAYAPLYYHIDGVHRPDSGRVVSPNASEIKILTSAEGLVLYCDTTDDFFLFNPLTNQTSILNYCPHTSPPNSTSSEDFYGMGYIYVENDYKIIRISTFNNPEISTSVNVYSRNRGTWHRTADLHSLVAITQAGVNVCERLHWITSNAINRYCITSFSIHTETYATIAILDIQKSNSVQQLYSLDSKTLSICCSFQTNGSTHKVWILRDYGDDSSWYSVEFSLATIIKQFGVHSVQLLSLIYPETTKMLLRVNPMGSFLVYDIEEKTFNEVGYEEVGVGYMCAYRFIPTLRSPHPIS